MWIRVEIAVRSALQRLGAGVGTPAFSIALAAAAVAFQATAGAWARLGSNERANALAGSWSYGVLALAVAVDAAATVRRRVPAALRAPATPDRADPRRRVTAALLALAYAGFACALLLSWRWHEEISVRLAEGEEYGDPSQVMEVHARRAAVPTPPRVELRLERVDPAPRADGSEGVRAATVLFRNGERATARRWWPLWLGPAVVAFPGEAGYAPRFELRDPRGATIETAFAKLEVLPPGRQDAVVFSRVPHRVLLERGAGGGWIGHAYRGKLFLASGTPEADAPLAFEGLRFSVAETRRTATLRIVRDPGIAAALAAIALAALAALARAAPAPSGEDADG